MGDKTYEQREREDKRDVFALAALAGLLAAGRSGHVNARLTAEAAFGLADAMLEVRDQAEAPPDAPKKEG